jgi:TIR domain
MAESTPVTLGRIFISYRREETAYPAGWLFDRLVHHFDGQVFKDVDSIQPGDDFVDVITTAVASCDVLLALIGVDWLTITDEHGRRRLDNPDDFVRLEIEAALTRGVRVIPILINGARMPRAHEVPDSLAKLVRRQALELSPARFDSDINRLFRVLDKTLAEAQALPAAEESAALQVESWPVSQSQEAGSRQPRVERSRAPEPSLQAPGATARPVQLEPDGGITFTARYPRVVAPSHPYALSVYLHLSRLQAEVDQRIAGRTRRSALQPAPSSEAALVRLPKGTRLWVRPEVPGIGFDPPVQEVRWLEDPQQVDFRLQALPHTAGRAVLGAVEAYVGPLPVAQVPLSIRVHGVRDRQERFEGVAASTGRLFGSVFASYAHEDYEVVKAVAEAYRALGINVLMDKVPMGGAEAWQQELTQLIEEADVFHLFWSKAASRSPRVAEEWRHALSLQGRKGERFIRPVYWNIPWPRPPAELKHLQMAPLDLALLPEVAGGLPEEPEGLARKTLVHEPPAV